MSPQILFRMSVVPAVPILLAAAGCKKTETTTTDTTGTASSTLVTALSRMRVTDIQLGNRAGPDHRVTNATTTFAPHDTMFVAVVTDGAESNATLAARWMQGAALLKEMEGTISASGGTTVTQFHVENTAGWPAGDYTVEILLDGVSAGTKTLTVK